MAEYDYSSLTMSELEALLRTELASEDPEKAMNILSILAQREPEDQERTKQAWETFQTKYEPTADERSLYEVAAAPAKRTRHPLLRAGSIAAVAAVAAGMMAIQAGGANPWQNIARWTTEQFSFTQTRLVTPDDPEQEELGKELKAVNETDSGDAGIIEDVQPENAAYASLGEAVDAMGLEGALVPSWMPEGYAFESAEITDFVGIQMLQAYYTALDGETFIRISYDHITDDSTVTSSVHEKDDTPVEIYEREGVTYYFLSNGEYRSVNWMLDGDTECSIGGRVTQQELRAIVDSMHDIH